jgi:hypothetical protein
MTRTFHRVSFIIQLIPAMGLAAGVPPNVISPISSGNTGAAPIGIAATTNEMLFTQPFCAGQQARGIYSANPLTGASTLITPFTAANTALNTCAENYLTISPGLGGFTAGDTFSTAASPTTSGQAAVLRNGVLFVDHIPAPHQHAGMTSDASGTFGGAVIVLAEGAVIGYSPTGSMLFTYPVPSTYVLEGGAVAPLTYAPCPGCLYITAELATDVNNVNPTGPGAIFRVLPGTPSGTTVSLFTTTPGIVEPEGVQFVTNNALACTNQGYSYFVSSYATTGQINSPNATNGSILEFTPAQLTPFVGDFLVPNETNGTIYAFSSAGASVVFSSGPYQLEGASILQCATHGCPATFGFWKHHAFPASMFSGGLTNLGCHLYSASDLLAVLNSNNAGGNAVTILGHQLIAAIANYAAGGTQTGAATLAIGQSLSLLCANSIDLSSSFASASSPLGQQLVALANTLDAYNSSAPNCEGQF